MKIISFGDIHDNAENLGKMSAVLESADIVLVTGDLTNYHGKDYAEAVINNIKEHNDTVLAQPGNLDQKDVDDYLTSLDINIHGNGYIFGDVGVFGVGGSNITPFKTPNEYSEEEIKHFLEDGYKKVSACKIKIMVPHMPPLNTKVDKVVTGLHVGSNSVREFIEKYEPDICICGHIHEAAGGDHIGNTLIFNAGMFKEGGYVEVEYRDGVLKCELKSVSPEVSKFTI